jgi:DNA-binding MarR family transcriptional regulator
MSAGDALTRFAAASENDLLHWATSAASAMGAGLFEALAARGFAVRPAHVPVFAGLDPAGTNISTLASRAGISRQAMSALVRDVEAAGYVRTAPDPADRRALVVELTDAGAEFCDAAADLALAHAAAWRQRLGDERYEQLLADLRAIAG